MRQTKKILEIDPDDVSEDWKLSLFGEWASDIVEELLGRDFTYKTRTQYYKGTGKPRMNLRCRPVYPAPEAPYSPISVLYDPQGYFGQASGSFSDPSTQSMVYGSDYTLQIDQDDNSSRSGILIRINNLWYKPTYRQIGLLSPFIDEDIGSYKITYTAGWTVDTVPAGFRAGVQLLVTRLRYLFPLGMAIGSEHYEDRSISLMESQRDYLKGLVKPLISSYRNWFW